MFSQHCKSCRALGFSEEKIEALKHWQVSDEFDELERALLAYTDGLVLRTVASPTACSTVLKKHLDDRRSSSSPTSR